MCHEGLGRSHGLCGESLRACFVDGLDLVVAGAWELGRIPQPIDDALLKARGVGESAAVDDTEARARISEFQRGTSTDVVVGACHQQETIISPLDRRGERIPINRDASTTMVLQNKDKLSFERHTRASVIQRLARIAPAAARFPHSSL